jgi:two-component system LytT family response regulator
MKLRAVVVDDEPLAIERLRQLSATVDDLRIVGTAGSAAEAVNVLRQAAPDVVFLDVELGDGTGFDVLAATQRADLPFVVFVTAYDAYAAEAFGGDAVDYLLKPCSPERFGAAIARLRQRMRAAEMPATHEQLLAACRALLRAGGTPDRSTRDGLFVEQDGRYVFVPAAAIDYVEAARNYVVIHAAGVTYCHRASISTLEQYLDAAQFVRIHKSVIVNLARVRTIDSDFHGTYVFRLAGGTSCRSGPSYRARVLELLRPRALRPPDEPP